MFSSLISLSTFVGLKNVSTPFEELVKLGYTRFEYLDWDNYLAFPDEFK